MTKVNKFLKKTKLNQLKPFSRYILSAFIILSFAIIGSKYKTGLNSTQPIMYKLGKENYTVSIDRVSEMYLTADLAYNMNLATKNYINMDYVSVTTQYALDQTNLSKLERPNIINIPSLSRGVREYIVKPGDNLDQIAKNFKLTTDQIRWSNNLPNKNIETGSVLLLPTTSGVVYTVKDGDNFDSIAKRYQVNKEHIISYNDLETSDGLSVGSHILLPNGITPNNERPEYVRPRQSISPRPNFAFYRPASTNYNPLPWGWCTWYAWQWRKDNMPANYHLPGSGLGDARYWDDNLRGRYVVNNTPLYGAVFQTDAGYYGHVGIVTAVNEDGSIQISDMNGVAGWGRVGSTAVPRSTWSQWDFIHSAVGS